MRRVPLPQHHVSSTCLRTDVLVCCPPLDPQISCLLAVTIILTATATIYIYKQLQSPISLSSPTGYKNTLN